MKIYNLILLLSFISNLSFSQTNQEVVNYFNSVCRSSEFYNENREPGSIRKWEENIFIYVKGDKPTYLMNELNSIITELNQMTKPITMTLVNDQNKSNLLIFFGSADVFKNIINSDYDLIDDNYGLALVYGSPSILFAKMYVDIYRTETINAQKHLLREELTQ
jgi:hypothetical protein